MREGIDNKHNEWFVMTMALSEKIGDQVLSFQGGAVVKQPEVMYQVIILSFTLSALLQFPSLIQRSLTFSPVSLIYNKRQYVV